MSEEKERKASSTEPKYLGEKSLYIHVRFACIPVTYTTKPPSHPIAQLRNQLHTAAISYKRGTPLPISLADLDSGCIEQGHLIHKHYLLFFSSHYLPHRASPLGIEPPPCKETQHVAGLVETVAWSRTSYLRVESLQTTRSQHIGFGLLRVRSFWVSGAAVGYKAWCLSL